MHKNYFFWGKTNKQIWNHGVNDKILKRPDMCESVQKAQVHGRRAQYRL